MQSKALGFLAVRFRYFALFINNKKQKTMKKQMIGLNTYLYTFPLICKVSFELAKKELATKGIITEVFINNKLGFELKLFNNI